MVARTQETQALLPGNENNECPECPEDVSVKDHNEINTTQKVIAAASLLFSAFCFSCNGAMITFGRRTSAMQFLFFRGLFATIIMLIPMLLR